MQPSEQTELTTKIIPEDARISPMPTNGDTIPPKAKQTAPSSAEAVPAFSRWHSIAKAVVEVKVSPIMNRSAIKSSSYSQKLHPDIKAAHSHTATATIPVQPASVQLSGRRNLTDKAAPTPIVTALTAKQKLNVSAEKL